MKILVCGDYCPQNRLIPFVEQGRFEAILGNVKPVVQQTDYAIVNLECPVTTGTEKEIQKCGTNLQCTENAIKALKWAGFQCVTLANNHILDYGSEGVKNTLTICERQNMDYVGCGLNLDEACRVKYVKVKGKVLAIINCCEHEFSIALKDRAGANPLNPIQQFYAIQEAKKHSDSVLVIVHGGHEHYQLPSMRMVETYRFFIDAGADAVVNHHQHCFSGYETYKGKIIVYGLGNFCFDSKTDPQSTWNESYMAMIDFYGDEINLTTIPCLQCDAQIGTRIVDDRKKFDEEVDRLNAIIANLEELGVKNHQYYEKFTMGFQSIFQPYRGKVLTKLYLLHLLPSLLSNGRLMRIRNLVDCESHKDRLLHFLHKFGF